MFNYWKYSQIVQLTFLIYLCTYKYMYMILGNSTFGPKSVFEVSVLLVAEDKPSSV